ncbi:MAG TPA: phosphatidylserine decarboxylase [Candidatus Nanoarchaeia archaeon]|nr:phosphatidylserine decarboxylase [Candidatus Nanoarchaeia archaeon]
MIKLIFVVLIILTLIVGLFLLQFYRDPKRTIPEGNIIVSPADGKVMKIIRTSDKNITVDKGYLGKIKTLTNDVCDDCVVISIFMSPIDAHINRAPITGKVISVTHTPGKFFAAYDLEKSLMNEKAETIIENKEMKIKVIQIAGFVARRVIPYMKEGDEVEKGQKIGQIALGSQATLIMPADVKIIVKEGEHVKAGSSIIAKVS